MSFHQHGNTYFFVRAKCSPYVCMHMYVQAMGFHTLKANWTVS